MGMQSVFEKPSITTPSASRASTRIDPPLAFALTSSVSPIDLPPIYVSIGISQPVAKHRHRLAPTGWAYKFFEEISIASFMISMSIR